MMGIRSFFVLLAVLASHAGLAATANAEELAGQFASPPLMVADQSAPQSDRDALLRRRAEDLARAASERFSEILSENEKRVAQAKAPTSNEDGTDALNDDTLRPVWDWLGRASQAYEDVIIAKFRNPSGTVAIVAPPGAAEPKPPAGFLAASDAASEPQPQLSWAYVEEQIRAWLAGARRSYRNEIVKQLVEPAETEAPAAEANVAAPAEGGGATRMAAPSEPAKAATSDGTGVPVPEPKAEVIAKAMPAAASDTSEVQRKARAQVAAEAKREKAAAEEASEDEKRRLAAEADAERKAVAEAKRLAAQAEAKRKAAAEAKRLADKAEAERKAAARAKQLAAETEARRKAAEEAKRLAAEAEAKRKAAQEAKRQAEAAEAKRKAALEAEAKRKAAAEELAKRRAKEAEAKRKADAEQAAQQERERLARAEIENATATTVVQPERKDASAGSASQAAGTSDSTTRPAVAAATPKARKQPVVSAPVRAKVERKKRRVSKSHYRKKRWNKRRSRQRVAHVQRRTRKQVRVFGYRAERKATRHRVAHRNKHWRKRHRIYSKKKRYRHYKRGRSGTVHVVRRGDTLTRIARRYYGNGNRYRVIYRANRRKIRNPNLIYPRQRLYIP